MSLKIYAGGFEMPYESFTFPGGEPHVKLKIPEIQPTIVFRPKKFEEFGTLLLVTEVLRQRWSPILYIPYFPGARQDRRTSRGEPLTVRVIADLINSQEYQSVVVVDPHSPVVEALVNNLTVLPAGPFVQEFIGSGLLPKGGILLPRSADWFYQGLVCPDAGAEKRTEEIAKHIGQTNIVYARKHRDMATGKLSDFSCETPTESGRYLLVDDICDGGGTFIGVTQAFQEESRRHGMQKNILDLWVSHGIFSKGLDSLKKEFQNIGCTDSIDQSLEGVIKVPVMKHV